VAPLLAFGAHPDDLEFGCGAVLAKEAAAGREVHCVVCSRGEAATNGTPRERTAEARNAAALLGAKCRFLHLDGDAHLEIKPAHAIALAALIREVRPSIVLAPTCVENQHPDHAKLGRLVRDACRLARFGGLAELRRRAPHSVDHLFFYAVSPGAEPSESPPFLIDVSAPDLIDTWTRAMQAHASQMRTRDYIDYQLTRARLHGLRAGVDYAIPLWSEDPLVFASLRAAEKSARHF
jgi:LmbE family N-acetylglucosaminyl deacetylase